MASVRRRSARAIVPGMPSPHFGRVTAGLTLAILAAILGSVLPSHLARGSWISRGIGSASAVLGLAAWSLGVVYVLALLDPNIGLREALRSRHRPLVVVSILGIGGHVLTVAAFGIALLASHGQ
jgi:hypothetical protein